MKNTKEKGMVRIIFISHKDNYEAVCLDFDLVEEGKSREEVQENIMEAIKGHLVTVCKNNLSDNLLNRRAEPKYWKMYHKCCTQMAINGLSSINKSICTYPIKDLVRS